MNVTFAKTAERRYRVSVEGPGVVSSWMEPAAGYDARLPHDMAHFVVENELGIAGGVFGQLAAGGQVALLLVIAIFSIATRGSGHDPAAAAPAAGDQQTETAEMQRRKAANRAYPNADYDEAEPSDPSKRAARREKQKRYNKFGMVMKDPHPDTARAVVWSSLAKRSDSRFGFCVVDPAHKIT